MHEKLFKRSALMGSIRIKAFLEKEKSFEYYITLRNLHVRPEKKLITKLTHMLTSPNQLQSYELGMCAKGKNLIVPREIGKSHNSVRKKSHNKSYNNTK